MAVQKVITAKNNFKHDRGLGTEEEIEAATKDLQQTLDLCIKALAFFRSTRFGKSLIMT